MEGGGPKNENVFLNGAGIWAPKKIKHNEMM